MSYLVRAGLRYNRWLDTADREPPDFPADVIGDLRTSGDKLSVFELSDRVTAERAAIAVAAGKDPAQTAYAVFDRAAVERLGIIPTKTPGTTLDAVANDAHYDLPVGTVNRPGFPGDSVT